MVRDIRKLRIKDIYHFLTHSSHQEPLLPAVCQGSSTVVDVILTTATRKTLMVVVNKEVEEKLLKKSC